MDEPQEAMKLLDQGIAELQPRFQYHANTLLTANRAIYLHPSLRAEIDLTRLTKVLQWFDSDLNETAVFEEQRQNLFNLRKEFEDCVKKLPTAIWDPLIDAPPRVGAILKARNTLTSTVSRLLWSDGSGDHGHSIFRRLSETFSTIEAMIEDISRFQAYKAEIQVIQELGIGFSRWKQPLVPGSETAEDRDLLLITALEPLNLTLLPAGPAVSH
jgi:hypothetical protein